MYNIKVLGFPAADYDRTDLQDEQQAGHYDDLLAGAKEHEGCIIWESLSEFQNAVNNDDVETTRLWIIFIEQ